MEFVYMIECADGSLYTGWTTNLSRRLAAHCGRRDGAKYTRSHIPVRFAYTEACPGKSAAMRREAALKALPRARKLALAAPRAEAERLLARDAAGLADMREALRRGLAHVVSAGENGVALRLYAEDLLLVWAPDSEAALRLTHDIPAPEQLLVHGDACAQALRSKYAKSRAAGFLQYAYLGGAPAEKAVPGVVLRRVGARHAAIVCQTYGHMADEAYVRERIAAGAVTGAFCAGQLAGFIGEHAEGSMGMLEVLPAYRGRGIGEMLERAAIRHALAAGRTPFCQVAPDNAASIGLQRKLGLTPAETPIFWLF